MTEKIVKIGLAAAKETIIFNLKAVHQGKWVNPMCALAGIKDLSLGFRTLRKLLDDNIVELKLIPTHYPSATINSLPMYRFNPFQNINFQGNL